MDLLAYINSATPMKVSRYTFLPMYSGTQSAPNQFDPTGTFMNPKLHTFSTGTNAIRIRAIPPASGGFTNQHVAYNIGSPGVTSNLTMPVAGATIPYVSPYLDSEWKTIKVLPGQSISLRNSSTGTQGSGTYFKVEIYELQY